MNRAAARLLVVILGWGVALPLECAGWQPTAGERMDCCARAEHDCPDQSVADIGGDRRLAISPEGD